VADLKTYYKDTDFLRWLVAEGFVSHNESNISKYYALYQNIKMCKENRCYDCAGLCPIWKDEEEIANDRVKTIKCVRRTGAENEARARAFECLVPAAFKNISLDQLDRVVGDAKAAIEAYINLFPNNIPKGLYIHGNGHSIGKTSALWYIASQLVRRGVLHKGFILHTTVIFIDELQTDMMTDDHPLMVKARTCDILMLDDFGNEKATPWSSSRLKAILEERIWHEKATVLASNIPPVSWMWKSKDEADLLEKIKQSMKILNLVGKDTDDSAGKESALGTGSTRNNLSDDDGNDRHIDLVFPESH
jgi:DNA replication protein DnaC